MKMIDSKRAFEKQLKNFVKHLPEYSNDSNDEWVIKGFVDVYRNVYLLSNDAKIVSKILEIHLFPQLLQFAEEFGYNIILASRQNYYPDFSFVRKDEEEVRFAVDIKSAYRLPSNPGLCNGLTLGSHGNYFINRTSKKNIQFPYASYLGHYCLGVIYDRTPNQDAGFPNVATVDSLCSISSVIRNLQFFAAEKWKIASDKSGSGNTANIGSVKSIASLFSETGVFANLSEEWFDDYWRNYGRIMITDADGTTKRLSSLQEFLKYRGRHDLIAKLYSE